jgi:hypothetical protein
MRKIPRQTFKTVIAAVPGYFVIELLSPAGKQEPYVETEFDLDPIVAWSIWSIDHDNLDGQVEDSSEWARPIGLEVRNSEENTPILCPDGSIRIAEISAYANIAEYVKYMNIDEGRKS